MNAAKHAQHEPFPMINSPAQRKANLAQSAEAVIAGLRAALINNQTINGARR